MLTNEQIQSLKEELLTQKEQYLRRDDMEGVSLEESNEREQVGELSNYDNHPADSATELFEREKNLALNDHAEGELEKVEEALQALENGEYGRCKECGKEISYDRLAAVPATLYCAEHADRDPLSEYRPVEENVIHETSRNQLSNTDEEVKDYQDSFQEVASYGTSETPSDFTEDHDSYDQLYEEADEPKDGFTQEYENFIATDIKGENRGFYRSEKEQDYTEELDEENIESPLGDIPYKEKDSYIDDK